MYFIKFTPEKQIHIPAFPNHTAKFSNNRFK